MRLVVTSTDGGGSCINDRVTMNMMMAVMVVLKMMTVMLLMMMMMMSGRAHNMRGRLCSFTCLALWIFAVAIAVVLDGGFLMMIRLLSSCRACVGRTCETREFRVACT